jgi:arabinogalactan oligomer/maltooligosaccharide transport system permease protein
MNSIVHVILAALSFIWLLPIVFAVLTSFREESGSFKTYIMPKAFTLANYTGLFEGSLN